MKQIFYKGLKRKKLKRILRLYVIVVLCWCFYQFHGILWKWLSLIYKWIEEFLAWVWVRGEHAITKINNMYYEKLTQVNWIVIVCLHAVLLEMSSMISFSSIMIGVCRKQGMSMRVSLSALFLIRLICSMLVIWLKYIQIRQLTVINQSYLL